MAYFGQGGGDGLRPFNVPGVFGPFYSGFPVGFGGYGAFIIPGPPPPLHGFPGYALPGPPAFLPPGPTTFVRATFVPPMTQGINLLKMDEYIEKRLIAHINNGCMNCGVLRYAYPNGNLLSEAIEGSYRGAIMVLGKVVANGTFLLLPAYRSCGARHGSTLT